MLKCESHHYCQYGQHILIVLIKTSWQLYIFTKVIAIAYFYIYIISGSMRYSMGDPCISLNVLNIIWLINKSYLQIFYFFFILLCPSFYFVHIFLFLAFASLSIGLRCNKPDENNEEKTLSTTTKRICERLVQKCFLWFMSLALCFFFSLNLSINPSDSHRRPPSLTLTVFNITLYTFFRLPPPRAVHLCVWRHEAMKP